MNSAKSMDRSRAKQKGWSSISAQYQEFFRNVAAWDKNVSNRNSFSKPFGAQKNLESWVIHMIYIINVNNAENHQNTRTRRSRFCIYKKSRTKFKLNGILFIVSTKTIGFWNT